MRFRTWRLALRPWREEDAEVLYSLCRVPEIGWFAGFLPHANVEGSREILRTVLMREGTFAITRKEDDVPIGCAGWMPSTAPGSAQELELGYWMGREYWGRGYTPEAVRALLRYCFIALRQPRVWCAHYEGNQRSRRVIEKCGFCYAFSLETEVKLLHERRLTHYYTLPAAQGPLCPGDPIQVRIDRPLGSRHPKHSHIYYPVNYGYVPGRFAQDGEEQDVYVLGVEKPVETFAGELIAIIHRLDDVEDKWVAAPSDASFTREEILQATAFQEQYFQIELWTKEDELYRLEDSPGEER